MQRSTILNFVRQFSRLIFEHGGHIVHGSHPSITPVLLEECKRHQEQGGRKDALMLAVSRLWSKNPNIVPLDEWRQTAIVYETPEVTGERSRDESLEQLRRWLVARCDAVVVVGGKWWHTLAGRAGIPLELGLAIERGLPCFLLGGLGGVAQDFVKNNPDILSRLKNGLDLESNRMLSTKENIESIAAEVCTQLERLPLVRGRGYDGASFRILSLDGGGLKGAFTAAALAAWEKQTGLRIVDHFDLIAGTSTGGILAIGIGLGLSGQQMLNFYMKRGATIFPITRLRSRFKHTVQHFLKPKYAQEVLLHELENAYYSGGKIRVIKDSICRLVIPTYHALAGASHLFRTPHHPDLTADANTEAAHAALATAAAPTFFTAAKIANMVAESSYFDGGVWANSPAMAAVIEAVCFLRIPVERIDVLSVGTTDEPFTVRKQIQAGIVGWLWKKKILELLMNVQQESSLKLTKCLLGAPRFLRVNTTTKPGIYSLDSPEEIEELSDLGCRSALDTDTLGQVKSRFLNGVYVAPWERFC
ncbi:MAG: patatin-like phospholipase family protein [Desulfatiglans sp.]|nr:patatin-like phospholipase family protein [Desulfatiglans sp.]